ncbi:MAG TPA: class I SAM-dependent methyltransferase [Negativicutes bacterium]|nr:class I SAM-dependent methyltransferase [Negativicutes bacterium]
MISRNAIDASRMFLEPVLAQAGCVVDATAGNGHDVLFFCRNTLPNCRIWAFDIQLVAINSCAALLKKHDFHSKVNLVQADHATLNEYVREPVDAAIFNLGYLPGKDHTITTTPLSLAAALDALIGLLATDGRIAIVAYPGHEPGRMEVEFLESYLSACPQSLYVISRLSFINQRNDPAILYSIGKTRRNQHEDTPSVKSEGNRRKTCDQDPG